MKKLLLIGYGNPGRLDDGLGPAFAEMVQEAEISGVVVDSDYQLNVEDASDIAQYEVVVFVDAALDATEEFYFKEIVPASDVTFSTHSITAENVLGLSHQMFSATTKGYALGIRGYEFNEFGQRLSSQAQVNLKKAFEFFIQKIQEWQ